MCFALYVATAGRLPIVPWNEAARDINTAELTDHDRAVISRFTRPNVYYIGSDLGCGCGFRHNYYPDAIPPEEEFDPDEDAKLTMTETNGERRADFEFDPDEEDDFTTSQLNHERLVEFLRLHLGGETTIELYGVWEGDFAEPEESHQSIPIERILDPNFCFQERGHYTVDLTKAG